MKNLYLCTLRFVVVGSEDDAEQAIDDLADYAVQDADLTPTSCRGDAVLLSAEEVGDWLDPEEVEDLLDTYTCPFCKATVGGDVAMSDEDDGWVMTEQFRGVCPTCAAKHLDYDEQNGQHVLKAGHTLPE